MCRRPISLETILLSDEVREVFLSFCLELQMNCSCLIYLKLSFSLACCMQIQFKITALTQLCTGQLVSNSTHFYYAMKVNETVSYFIANITVKLRISVLDVQCIYFLCWSVTVHLTPTKFTILHIIVFPPSHNMTYWVRTFIIIIFCYSVLFKIGLLCHFSSPKHFSNECLLKYCILPFKILYNSNLTLSF